MTNSVEDLLNQVRNAPESVEFNDVIEVINSHYDYTPARFSNGDGAGRLVNEAGSNEGSCKIFAFAQLHDLDQQQTLSLFGRYYRDDVLAKPEGTDHGNIRNFMRSGWAGIHFDSLPLKS